MLFRCDSYAPFLLVLGSIALSSIPTKANELRKCGSGDINERISACSRIISNGSVSKLELAAALDGRCWAYNLGGDYESAVSDCKKAIRLNPSYAYAYNNLGVALEKLGRLDEAIVNFRKALSLKANFQVARDNLERISSLPSAVPPEPKRMPTRSPACEKYPDLC